MALLRVCELDIPRMADLTKRTGSAVRRYIESYLLKDAASNPFAVTPYGVFVKPLHSDEVAFRDAGANNFVRTFISPLNAQEMVHGTDAVLMQHAYLLARAAFLWKEDLLPGTRAKRLIQWATGHNTTGLCLFTGVGFRHPVIASFVNYRIPTPRWTASSDDWTTPRIWRRRMP